MGGGRGGGAQKSGQAVKGVMCLETHGGRCACNYWTMYRAIVVNTKASRVMRKGQRAMSRMLEQCNKP